MKSGGDVFSLRGQLIKLRYGSMRIKGGQFDSPLPQNPPGLFSHFHQSRCAAANDQERGPCRDDELQVVRGQHMPLLPPPVRLHGITHDQAIAVVRRGVNDHFPELI
jgi:hypothetical protein